MASWEVPLLVEEALRQGVRVKAVAVFFTPHRWLSPKNNEAHLILLRELSVWNLEHLSYAVFKHSALVQQSRSYKDCCLKRVKGSILNPERLTVKLGRQQEAEEYFAKHDYMPQAKYHEFVNDGPQNLPPFAVSPYMRSAMDQLLAICRKNHIPVFFKSSPLWDEEGRRMDGYYQRLKAHLDMLRQEKGLITIGIPGQRSLWNGWVIRMTIFLYSISRNSRVNLFKNGGRSGRVLNRRR